ncbi:MAG: hypothetical protein IKE65_05110 [Clostridia bacterium]|nr:hypothetical protein [Clostridia bacterium]
MKSIKTNFGKQVICLCAALLIALPVRIYQYLQVIEDTSGFYTTWTNPTVFGLYGLCAVIIVLIIAFSFKGRKKTIYAMPTGKKTGLGAVSIVTALAFLVESAYSAFRAYQISSGILPVEQLVLHDNVGKPTLAFTLVQCLFGLLSAAFFVLFAASCLTGKNLYKKVSIMAASPVIWCIARLMIGFTQTISYRYVSELLFELLFFVFFAMFGVAFAKMCADVPFSRLQMRMLAYGMLSTFFGLLVAVPRYIVFLMGKQSLLYRQTSLFEITDLVLPVFVMIFIFSVVATKQFKSVEEYAASEEQTQE